MVGQTTREVREVQYITHRHLTIRDLISDASIKPLADIPLACCVILASFYEVILADEAGFTYISDPLFHGTFSFFEQSMGVLTTGLYDSFCGVLPYVITF